MFRFNSRRTDLTIIGKFFSQQQKYKWKSLKCVPTRHSSYRNIKLLKGHKIAIKFKK